MDVHPLIHMGKNNIMFRLTTLRYPARKLMDYGITPTTANFSRGYDEEDIPKKYNIYILRYRTCMDM